MPLKVIGAGFGRTGTTSLKIALEELGFEHCYHMQEVMKNPSHAPFWEKALERQPVDWEIFFADYQATVDWPACTFYKELMEAFPEAKVLLSVREPNGWYESTRDTIYRIPTSFLMVLLKLLVPHLRRMYRVVQHISDDTFQGRFMDRDFAIAVFNQHNTSVMEHVPPERLLIYNVKEGWEPLCRFLEVPVPPDRPFPHLNDKLVMQRAMRYGPALILTALSGSLILLVWLALVMVAD